MAHWLRKIHDRLTTDAEQAGSEHDSAEGPTTSDYDYITASRPSAAFALATVYLTETGGDNSVLYHVLVSGADDPGEPSADDPDWYELVEETQLLAGEDNGVRISQAINDLHVAVGVKTDGSASGAGEVVRQVVCQ